MRAWRSKEICTAKANDLGRLCNGRGTQIAAPYLTAVEVTNALHQRVVRGELTLEAATQRIESLLSSGPELRQQPHLYSRALELAGQPRQGATYDAHYPALAEKLGCELWTADERLYRAASPAARSVRWIGESATHD